MRKCLGGQFPTILTLQELFTKHCIDLCFCSEKYKAGEIGGRGCTVTVDRLETVFRGHLPQKGVVL